MKFSRRHIVQLLVALGLLGTALPGLEAATSSPGPYYALPSWDQSLAVSTRFIVLTNMESMAVLDRETGLVWERRPGWEGEKFWPDAMAWCDGRRYGYRLGWRLPTAQEMASLMGEAAPVGGGAATLQTGHPFDLSLLPPPWVGGTLFWTSTPDPKLPTSYYTFDISGYHGSDQLHPFGLSWKAMVWCVRGPGGLVAN